MWRKFIDVVNKDMERVGVIEKGARCRVRKMCVQQRKENLSIILISIWLHCRMNIHSFWTD